MRTKLAKWTLSLLLALILLVSSVPALASEPDDADGKRPPIPGLDGEPWAPPDKPAPASDKPPEDSQQQVGEVHRVTLITGDIVTVAVSDNGTRSFAIIPADPTKLGQSFLTEKLNGYTYIIPDSANLAKLDRELFNIDYLVDEEYYREDSLPLLVSYSLGLPQSQVQSLEDRIKTLGQQTERLREVSTISGWLIRISPRLTTVC